MGSRRELWGASEVLGRARSNTLSMSSQFPPDGSIRVIFGMAPLKDEWNPHPAGVEFPAGFTLPKAANFGAVSGNRINAFRIELQGVGMNRRRWYAF